ncbi:MAG: small subunit ribosomal protein S9, partial [Parcubacteria group bacterium Athens0714_26]
MKTKKEDKKEQKTARYFEGNGSRKTSHARVRISPNPPVSESGILINGKDYKQYFKNQKYQEIVESPLEAVKGDEEFGVSVVVSGGGLTGQAEAIRHGIARALVKYNEELR